MSEGPQAGWYPDSVRPDLLRYWNGYRWTDDLRYAATGIAVGVTVTGQYNPRPFGGQNPRMTSDT